MTPVVFLDVKKAKMREEKEVSYASSKASNTFHNV